MFKRIGLGAGGVLAAYVVLGWIASTSSGRLAWLLVCWALMVYLLVRAWPGVRVDVARLAGLRRGRSGYRHARGDVL